MFFLLEKFVLGKFCVTKILCWENFGLGKLLDFPTSKQCSWNKMPNRRGIVVGEPASQKSGILLAVVVGKPSQNAGATDDDATPDFWEGVLPTTTWVPRPAGYYPKSRRDNAAHKTKRP